MNNSSAIFILIMGIILLVIGIWIVARRNRCSVLIQAEYIKCNPISVNCVTSYYPVFRFTYNSTVYENQSFDSISKKQYNTYRLGYFFPVYINPNNPRDIVMNKKFKFTDGLIIIIGLLFVLFSIIYFMTV